MTEKTLLNTRPTSLSPMGQGHMFTWGDAKTDEEVAYLESMLNESF